jgi:hypothetical protein
MKRGAAPKTAYLANVPEPARSTLKRIRAVIQSVVPKGTTEVISYGIPMFKFRGMLVGYAAFRPLQPVPDGFERGREIRETTQSLLHK